MRVGPSTCRCSQRGLAFFLCRALAFSVCISTIGISKEPRLPDDEFRVLAPDEIAAWREKAGVQPPSRCQIVRWPHGGWAFVRPDGSPFQALGIEYEPLALYGDTDWTKIANDLDLIREAGFNTVAIWCLNFNVPAGGSKRLTIEEMARLAEMTRERGLYVQFYLLADRFTDKFPYAMLPDGTRHHFDIDYADPGLLQFIRAYAQRLAMALYPFSNVNTIIVWEEKIGISHEERGDLVSATALYASAAGKARFGEWLLKRHGDLDGLNNAWGTDYASLNDAVDQTLAEYQRGVPYTDPRQFDVLEFGTVLLADYAREFVEAYKTVDPTMLFSCRHFDLFGPQRAVHPAYAFLDSFGVNQYALGHKGVDITFREELVKTKLVAGMTGKAVYIGNFGFRTASWDGGTHGVVPNDDIKACIAADTVAVFNWIPEVIGSSYFTYYYAGWEGPWGIVDSPNGNPLPIYRALRSAHQLLNEKNSYVALADYDDRPRIHIFNGLDATFLLKPSTWLEHTELSYDLSEMKLNYDVLTDNSPMPDGPGDVMIANFSAYDRMLNTDVAQKLVDFAKRGGTLIVGPAFGMRGRYGHPNKTMAAEAGLLHAGPDMPEITSGPVTVLFPNKATVSLDDAPHVKLATTETFADGETLLWMQTQNHKQPGVMQRPLGRGKIIQFLFNPYCQRWYGNDVERINRASLPIFSFLFDRLGIAHDKRWATRGFQLQQGFVRIFEKPLHFYISSEPQIVGGTYEHEFGEVGGEWAGGVFTKEYLCFRGQKLALTPWEMEAAQPVSVAAARSANSFSFFVSDAVKLRIKTEGIETSMLPEPWRVYTISREADSPSANTAPVTDQPSGSRAVP